MDSITSNYFGRHDDFAMRELLACRYQVTPHGELWATHTQGLFKPRLVKAHDRGGYLRVRIMSGEKSKLFGLHRLVALVWVPRPDDGVQVNHLDGNKHNNHHLNLEWVSASANVQHAFDTGLNTPHTCRGEKSPFAKLTEERVTNVLLLRKQGLTYGEISIRTRVKLGTVANICAGKSWNHIYKRVMESAA